MTDKPWFLEGEKAPSMGTWIFSQMAKGAGYGAMIFFGVVFFIFIWVAIGSLLPEQSKEAEDPTPNSAAIEMPETRIFKT